MPRSAPDPLGQRAPPGAAYAENWNILDERKDAFRGDDWAAALLRWLCHRRHRPRSL